jgi:colanic acid biosynthesis glycosyl transferase WcaI
MARLFVITINYAPEPSGFAPHATQLAEHLARQGHDVSVFTGFPFAPAWRRRAEDRGRLYSRVRNGNLTVHRVTHFIPRQPSSVLQRIAMEGSFSVSGFAAILSAMLGTGGRPDVVVYIGAQPAAAMLARIVAALARCPYVVRITDLAARAAQDMGMIGESMARLLERLEFAAYRRAAGVSVLCGSFEHALMSHDFPRDRIRVTHNPIDLQAICPVRSNGSFRTRYEIPESAFLVMHAGSMGRKQGLLNVMSAAALTREATLRWVFVGDGEAHDELVAAVRAANLEHHVWFVPFQPQDELSDMFAAADVLLVNQLSTVKDTLIPGKLLTYMATGRPVLVAANPASQAAQLLKDADGGMLVAPDDPEALAEAARWFATAEPDALAAFGKHNRAYAERHFDERNILAAQEQLILDTLGATRRSPPASTPARH